MLGLGLDPQPAEAAPSPPTVPPGIVPFSNDETFAPSSFWRAPLAPDAPLHPDSARWARNVCQQFDFDPDTGRPYPDAVTGNAWFSHDAGGSPLYVVGPHAPTQTVNLTHEWVPNEDPLRASWLYVPVPDGMVVGNSMDASVCIWQPSTDTMWEFWVMQPVTGRPYAWEARWGGTMRHASQSIGVYQARSENGAQYEWPNWGHTASSLPINAGAVQPEEIDRGYIGHALHLTVGNTATSKLWPAQRTDGDGYWWRRTNGTMGTWRTGATHTAYPDLVPEGARLRFPATLDLAPYSGLTRLLAEAIRDHGMIVTDITYGGCSIRFRESTTYRAAGLPSPWNTRITDWPSNILWRMPLHQLQVVHPDVSRT